MREEDFYQIFITGSGEYLDKLLEKGLGGVIFFSKDIESAAGFKEKIADIKNKAIIPPFLSIDQEGGRVERTENIFPRRLSAGSAYQKGETFLKLQTEEMAEELKDFGINLNFAPVVDVNTNPENPVIGDRAFSDNPDDVIKGAKIVIDAYKKNNIITCAKHYPGHGDTIKDSHKDLPRVNITLSEMEKTHIAPFRELARVVPMIMVAHLDCECFGESGIPVSVSPLAIKYLREKLGFDGVIISDDMNMGGIAGISPLNAARRAIKAGVDILLYRASDDYTYHLIRALKEALHEDKDLYCAVEGAIQRIKRLKTLYGLI